MFRTSAGAYLAARRLIAGLQNDAPFTGLSRVHPALFRSPEIHFRAMVG
jgi:hypothetical protein